MLINGMNNNKNKNNKNSNKMRNTHTHTWTFVANETSMYSIQVYEAVV